MMVGVVVVVVLLATTQKPFAAETRPKEPQLLLVERPYHHKQHRDT